MADLLRQAQEAEAASREGEGSGRGRRGRDGRKLEQGQHAVADGRRVGDVGRDDDIDGDQRHGLFSVRAMLFAQPSISGQSRLSPNRPPKAWKNKREGNGH